MKDCVLNSISVNEIEGDVLIAPRREKGVQPLTLVNWTFAIGADGDHYI